MRAASRPDNARHLRRQDSQQTLDVADDHRAAILENGQGEEFNFLEISRAASARRRQAQVGKDLMQILGNLFQPLGKGP